MPKLYRSIVIQASKETVWHTMLDDATYRDWTTAFNPGSYYVGDWSTGSKMLFLGPNPEGPGEGGMVSRVAENQPYTFLSLEHTGMIKDGVEDTTSDLVKKWTPAFENYTFTEVEGGTQLSVEMDLLEEYLALFGKMWDEALQRLKVITETR